MSLNPALMRPSLRTVSRFAVLALAAAASLCPANAETVFERGADAIGSVFEKSRETIPYCEPGQNCSLKAGSDIVADGVNDIVKDRTASQYAQDVAANVVAVLSIVGVLFIIYAGFLYLTANGEEEKTGKAKSIIVSVLIGFVIVFLAWGIVSFVTDRILAPAPQASASATFGN